MLNLILAAAFFFATHVGIAGTRLRGDLVRRFGARRYALFYSILSTVGVVWLFWAYLTAPYVELWGQLYGLREAALAAMFISFLFVGIGLLSKPPTLFGAAALEYRAADVAGILRVTRHPILIGLLLWSVTHMIVNGDVAALILFGSLTALTVIGIASMDAKHRQRIESDWDPLAACTSIMPFGAIASGRNRLAVAEIGAWRPAVALAVFVLTLDLHVRVIGVSPLPASLF
ncbi:MAG: NnrU family protein [Gammaproteobacteria bacterium]